MRKLLFIIVTVLAGVFFAQDLLGQQLVYRPKNPNFGGGDTFMYQQLLSSAESQNDFAEDTSLGLEDENQVDKFAEDLNRQLLNQVSRQLLDQTFGGDTLQPGTFTFGTLSLEIFETAEGLVINILDTQTGDTSQIVVPN